MLIKFDLNLLGNYLLDFLADFLIGCFDFLIVFFADFLAGLMDFLTGFFAVF